MSKKWSKWLKSEATWANIRASEARLVVYVTFYFPWNIIKIFISKCFPQSAISNNSIIHVVFMTMYMDVLKEHIFIYRWNIHVFHIFAHTFFNHVPHHVIGNLLHIEKMFQFSAVVIRDIQYDLFSYFKCTKNSTHYKTMVPGLWSPAGGPCKSEDITGQGLMKWRTVFKHVCKTWSYAYK